MIKKIVPDPPHFCRVAEAGDSPSVEQFSDSALAPENTTRLLDSLTFTRSRPVSPESPSKPSLFAIQQGVSAHDALAHVSRLLEIAELNGDELSLHTDPFERALFWSMLHSVEMARAVVDALLDGAPATDLNTPNS